MSEHTYKCLCGVQVTLPPNASGGDPDCPYEDGSGDHGMSLVTAVAPARPVAGGPGESGLAVVGDMGDVIKHLFRRAQNIAGSQLVDDETGIVVAESEGMTFNINEFLGDPPVESVEIGDDGEVKHMKVKPHEWPPRKEGF